MFKFGKRLIWFGLILTLGTTIYGFIIKMDPFLHVTLNGSFICLMFAGVLIRDFHKKD